jgi:tRNA(Ile)-lysidine synthase
VAYLEDPMNLSRTYLRGRVRHDLLPALAAATPGFSEDMLAIADRAASWRREVEQLVDGLGVIVSPRRDRVSCPAAAFDATSREGRAVLWPAVCARAGVTLDAKGTRELVKCMAQHRRGSTIRLSGGAIVLQRGAARNEAPGDWFEVRRAAPRPLRDGPRPWIGVSEAMPPRFGRFRWRRLPTGPVPGRSGEQDLWTIGFPRGLQVTLRVWTAGDRIRTAGAPAGRRVTRYLAEAHVSALDRPSWPVALVDGEPVWVPGVCRGVAAPSRLGWPEFIWYRCEPEFD